MAAASPAHRYPDFIIAGAPRAATTWLYTLADRHPDIAMAKPVKPEPKFFLVDALFERGLNYYAATWFNGIDAGHILGEKSTNYLESPITAERIQRSLPEIRLVFMLRNPVERAYSNYLWTRQNGLETECFQRALELEDERERTLAPELRYARPFSYFSRGLYAQHLGRFFERFRPEQILVLFQEEVALRPRWLAERFQRFVGAAPMPDLVEGLGAINVAMPKGAPPMAQELRSELACRYAEPNFRLQQLLGMKALPWHDPGWSS